MTKVKQNKAVINFEVAAMYLSVLLTVCLSIKSSTIDGTELVQGQDYPDTIEELAAQHNL